MPADRQLPDQLPLYSMTNGSIRPALRLGAQMADHLAVGGTVRRQAAGRRRRDGRLPGAQPVPVALVDLTPGPLVAQPYGAEGDVAVRQLDRPGAFSGRPLWGAGLVEARLAGGRRRGSGPRRGPAAGSSTASPSLTPPVEPGRLTISVRPATPARPRESAAVGTFAQPVGADGLGDARRSRSPGPRGSPRGCGRWARCRCRRWSRRRRTPAATAVPQRLAPPARRPGTTRGPSTAKPSAASPSTMQRAARVRVDPGGGAVGGGDDEGR